MTRACHTAVHMATGGVFSEAEVDDLLDRLSEKARRARMAAPDLSERAAIAQAAGELTREQLLASLTAQRMKIAAEAARTARRAKLAAMPAQLDEAERLQAHDVGRETQGFGTSSSVDAEGRARQMSLWGQVEIGLRKMPGLINRASNFWGVGEREFDRKAAREIARLTGNGAIEPTGDEGALHYARVVAPALERARTLQNDQGAWIAKLPGYIARQSHDRLKVAGGFWRELAQVAARVKEGKGLSALDWKAARTRAARLAFGRWRDTILPLLHDDTFKGLELEDVPFEKWEDDAQEARQLGRRADLADAAALNARGLLKNPDDLKERMLWRVWNDIITGRHEQLSGADDHADFRPPASKARAVSQSRVLIFKGPDEWMDYNDKFGTGGLHKAVMGQLERSARNAALMKAWGPAPDAARAAEISRLEIDARNRGDPDVVGKLNGWKTAAAFDAINGRLNVPENLRLAMIVKGLRSWEAVTKLGSIVLSKSTDLPMTGHTFARAGAGFLAGYEGAITGILRLQGAEARHAAELLDVGARSFAGHLAGQFNAADGALGWGSWAQRLMYRLNLFEAVNEGLKKGAAGMYARHLGAESEAGWEGLRQGTRETFERFGIDAKAWDLARQGVEPAADGKKYFALDHLDKLTDDQLNAWRGLKGKAATPDSAARARADLALRFSTMIHDIIDNTTSDSRMREQIRATHGLKAGTAAGEAFRSFGQFRGFLAAILGRHLAPTFTGYAGYVPAQLIGHFIAATILAGYLSMNAKLISRGEKPKSFIGATPQQTMAIWGAALAQGGGLGIYGDYLFGEANRNGQDFAVGSTLGPAVGDLESVAKVVFQATHGSFDDAPGELVHIASRNIPLINLWYTRVALDYAVLWRMQEAVNPGYLQRYEDRARQQQGTDFFVPPTAALN